MTLKKTFVTLVGFPFKAAAFAARLAGRAVNGFVRVAGLEGLEGNKVFAAILTAGIVAGLAGFVSRELVHPHIPEKAVLDIDTSALENAASGQASGPTGPEPILALLEKADIKRGESLSKACTACHTFDKGGADRVGPNQWNLVMGPKAHRDGFAYSDALKALHAKGEKWTYSDLNHFIWKPSVAVPGTKMNYLGLKKPEDRAALIADLRTLADSPAALPSNEDIQAEQAAFNAAQPKPATGTTGTEAKPAANAPAEGKDSDPTAAKTDAPPAARQDGGQGDAIADKPSSDTSGAKPLQNDAPETGSTVVDESAVPATTHAVPPSASGP